MAIFVGLDSFSGSTGQEWANTHLWSRGSLSAVVAIRTRSTLKCLAESLHVSHS